MIKYFIKKISLEECEWKGETGVRLFDTSTELLLEWLIQTQLTHLTREAELYYTSADESSVTTVGIMGMSFCSERVWPYDCTYYKRTRNTETATLV